MSPSEPLIQDWEAIAEHRANTAEMWKAIAVQQSKLLNIAQPGNVLEGAMLELRELESKAERHARYLQEIANHHEEQRAMWESVGDHDNASYHEERRNVALFGIDEAGNGAA